MTSQGAKDSLLERQERGNSEGYFSPLRASEITEEERQGGERSPQLCPVPSPGKIRVGTEGSRALMEGPWKEGEPEKPRTGQGEKPAGPPQHSWEGPCGVRGGSTGGSPPGSPAPTCTAPGGQAPYAGACDQGLAGWSLSHHPPITPHPTPRFCNSGVSLCSARTGHTDGLAACDKRPSDCWGP